MEVINSIQKEMLENFGSIPDSGAFYLTGGTALAAFYLKHRKSNDLDFFTAVPEIISPFSVELEKKLNKLSFNTKKQRGFNSFVELILTKNNETTLIHLALDAPFRFEPPIEKSDFPGVKIDSIIDIASNKLLALFQRATLRDFIDVYFLINEKLFTKSELIKLAKQKDEGFDLYWLGVAFEQINNFSQDSADILLLLKPCTIKELQEFFNSWKKEIIADLSLQ